MSKTPEIVGVNTFSMSIRKKCRSGREHTSSFLDFNENTDHKSASHPDPLFQTSSRPSCLESSVELSCLRGVSLQSVALDRLHCGLFHAVVSILPLALSPLRLTVLLHRILSRRPIKLGSPYQCL